MKLIKPQIRIFLFTFSFLLLSLTAHSAPLKAIPPGAPLPADRFVALAKLINPSVVNISTTQISNYGQREQIDPRDPYFNFLEQFMGRNRQLPAQRPSKALGSGFIIREDGLIITNNHVIDNADSILVQLSEDDETLYEAEVIGKDRRTDLALIKIKTKKKLPIARLGESKNLKVGEWVAAFGNPFGHGHSITKGIISAKGRNIDELNRLPFIQTDASINPGNSGGPLVNINGEVIGVNSAIDARAQGIGFAIPIDDVKAIIKILERDGQITRGYLGVYLANIDKENAKSLLNIDTTKGAVVTQVQDDTPAQKSGIKPYDFIYKVNNHNVSSANELIKRVADISAGEDVLFYIYRNGTKKTISVKLTSHPDQIVHKRRSRPHKADKTLSEYGLGLSNYSSRIRKRYNLPKLKTPQPVIVQIKPGSRSYHAGLSPGDIILDVNKIPVHSITAVKKSLRSDRINLLRILRGNQVFFAYLRPK